MPFKSDAQRRYMYSEHPKIAKRWSKEAGMKGNQNSMMTKKDDKKQDRQAAIERRLKVVVKNGGKNGKNGGK